MGGRRRGGPRLHLGLVGLAAAVAAVGAAAPSAAAPARSADASALIASAEALQAGLATMPAATFAARTELERRAIAGAMGPGDAARGLRLSWFMRAAGVRIAGPGLAEPAVGFYNPLSDAWLLTRWSRLDGAWRVVAARWTPAAALRGPDQASSWTERSGPWGDALAAEARAAASGFEARSVMITSPSPLASGAETSASDVYGRIDAAQAGLTVWAHDPAHRAAAEALLTAIQTGDAAKRDYPGGNGRLSSVPEADRNTLLPVAALQEPDGSALLLASPHAPQLIVAAEFDAKLKLRRLTMLNVAGDAARGGR
ncbi:MAG TPA: hypothetical protein VGI95_19250 [Caulobacteraceae bacterium]|jgi:hypothetical protein